jgi:hypothetical protein
MFLNLESLYFVKISLNSLCKKTPTTALLSFLNQSFTVCKLLGLKKLRKPYVLRFLVKDLRIRSFLSDTLLPNNFFRFYRKTLNSAAIHINFDLSKEKYLPKIKFKQFLRVFHVSTNYCDNSYFFMNFTGYVSSFLSVRIRI